MRSSLHAPEQVRLVRHPFMPCSCAVVGLLGSMRMGLVSWLPTTDWQLGFQLVLRFSCLCTITGVFVRFACGSDLVAWPLQWPFRGKGFAANPAACLEQLSKTALAAAMGSNLWRVSPLFALCLLCPNSALWLLGGSVCGTSFVARLCWWLFTACITVWVILERLGSTAWPHYRLITCFASYLLWAKFNSSYLGPSVRPGSSETNASVSAPEPIVPIVAVPAVRTPPLAATSPADNPPDLSAPSSKAALVEEALDETSPEQDASELAADRSIPDDVPYDPMPGLALLP
ncbi:hypothetical protein V6N11_002270 [Hibiscus sabdariffa]|uniref:Uncharacterized protein n=1 Tax=Hibiscus sabdariffa TaxID=183260 RepID=A0ABR2QUT9_9ROSI